MNNANICYSSYSPAISLITCDTRRENSQTTYSEARRYYHLKIKFSYQFKNTRITAKKSKRGKETTNTPRKITDNAWNVIFNDLIVITSCKTDSPLLKKIITTHAQRARSWVTHTRRRQSLAPSAIAATRNRPIHCAEASFYCLPPPFLPSSHTTHGGTRTG